MVDVLTADAALVGRARSRTARALPPVVAATLAVVVGVLKLQGTDIPAQLYRTLQIDLTGRRSKLRAQRTNTAGANTERYR